CSNSTCWSATEATQSRNHSELRKLGVMIENRTLNEALGLPSGGGKEHFFQSRGSRSQRQLVLPLHRDPRRQCSIRPCFTQKQPPKQRGNRMPERYVGFALAQDFAVVFRIA